MTKAILVLDKMPETCHDCKFCNNEIGFCIVLRKWVNNISDTRDYKCTLSPMPEKELSYPKDGWFMGWNDCIDEILGVEK